ncbi:MAG: host attachment family protein [Hoeflea sp.]|uniref:host attachment family protein n=1 Tax=Hoeflea sp. TaxID=1940281 RepID=UPI001D9D67FB|nr:host attachment family protein [Hoeflea sp.]MBU4527639.1 host attachment family protein [Alphaproteobacteria bacterium]MBU4546493.1 host attachment family protein [Alphaproteobacteria bacterium]MBU4552989.1 host attachment family protein [Alphaproteobacteria bacterium]MBV1724061.1 host attachment family protein [Hoeflea sp.]MBV1759746.1 host attachment family protein [Hoeflea sp.]
MSGIRLKHKGWVVVADGEKALFLSNAGTPDRPALEVFTGFEQPNPRTADQGVDRPGRLADGAGSAHRSAVQETDWHRLAKHEFAHQIASLLEQNALADRFEQLVIVAPAVIMGELRKSWSKSVSGRIIAEVAKDLTKHPVPEMEKILFG